MSCAENRLLLSACHDAELSPAELQRVRAHLARCAECARLLDALSRTSLHVQESLVSFFAPDALRERIRETLAQERNEGSARQVLRSPTPLMSWWGLAAAALLVALSSSVAAYAGLERATSSRDPADEVLASHVRSLMPGHLIDVASTDVHNVKPWFNGRLDLSPEVPALDAAGFPLVGGRLDYVSGRTVAAVVYARQQHIINVFSCPDAGADIQKSSTDARGYHLVRWRRDNTEYWAVSDIDARDLSRFVSSFEVAVAREADRD
jgi:anti-sigma factor RsiW